MSVKYREVKFNNKIVVPGKEKSLNDSCFSVYDEGTGFKDRYEKNKELRMGKEISRRQANA